MTDLGKKMKDESSKDGKCQNPDCRRNIPSSRARRHAKYCSHGCTMIMGSRRATERKKAEREILNNEETPATTKLRRGEDYVKLKGRPDLIHGLRSRTMTQEYVAEKLGCTVASVSRAWATIRADEKLAARNAGWQPHPYVAAMFPKDKLTRIRELGYKAVGTQEFEQLADDLTRAYAVASRRYFTLEGKRPIIKDFHLRWIRSIIVALATGGKQLILSPPRHGKSEMLIRFAVWLIDMEPNIRIMWIAANTDVAKLMLGAVKDHLENNERLIADTLPPGETFKPDRGDSKPWSGKEIKVRQQSHVGQKSSSMLALGRTAKILSRDVDLAVVDDMEDFDTTREPGQRTYSKNKLAEIGTRKEEHTALVYIGSRQHPDDIPDSIMGMTDSLAWDSIVETAHADCELDPDEIDGHDDNGCVLFPEVRSYRWLLEKKQEMDHLGIPGAYEMRYLNAPIPTEGLVFDVPLIRDEALDRSRDLGVEGLPAGRLVAGLDPSARGIQAAFCWHYANDMLSMVDLEDEEAGGFEGAHRVMRLWYDLYGLKDWFYEDNAQQVEFFDDPRTKKLALELGLTIKPYRTGKNKQDPEFGISSMAPWYHGGKVNLPFGTKRARVKVNKLLRQLELWTTEGVKKKHAKTDIKMAQWFPFPTIVKWGNQDRSLNIKEIATGNYPNMHGNRPLPWNTPYPKG